MVLQVISSRQLFRYYGMGDGEPPMVAALEREVAIYTGVRFALGVTSGTGAIEIALAALEVGPGDEVIVPAWSWISCFTAVVRSGARPVLAEIDETLNLAPAEIRRLCTPKTKAVLVVHYQGVPADMDPIMAEARAAGIKVIEDCAESVGARYKGRVVGSIGDINILSFQARKIITAGEGGMVLTNDARLYERAVRASDLGLYRPYHTKIGPSHEPSFAGGNYRMSELTGAVALAQFRRIDGMIAHLRALRQRLMEALPILPGLTHRRIPDPSGDLGFESYLFLPSAEAVGRLKELLTAAGVNCTQHTGTYGHYAREYCRNGLAQSPGASPFAGFAEWPAPGYREMDFPRTQSFTGRMMAIPFGMLYTEADADHIAAVLREGLETVLETPAGDRLKDAAPARD